MANKLECICQLMQNLNNLGTQSQPISHCNSANDKNKIQDDSFANNKGKNQPKMQ